MAIKNKNRNSAEWGEENKLSSPFLFLVFSDFFKFTMKENIINIKRDEIILSKRSRNLEELRGKVEAGQGSVGELMKFQILQERIRESKVKRD